MRLVQKLTLSNNVAGDIVTKSQVASDGNEQVDTAGTANTGQDDRGCPAGAVVLDLVENGEHVLMTCVGKDDDGETSQDRNDTLVRHDTDIALETHVIAFCKVVNNQHDEIANRDKSNDAGVLERVESAEEGKRNNNQPGHLSETGREKRRVGHILT
jgi:hypothetical protein